MSVSIDDYLSQEKFRIFTMPLSQEELDQIKDCRHGIIGASSLGTLFGVFCGKIALGPAPASIFLKSLVIGGIQILRILLFLTIIASALTGAIVGAGLSVQQSYSFLKSKPTNLAQELKKFSYQSIACIVLFLNIFFT